MQGKGLHHPRLTPLQLSLGQVTVDDVFHQLPFIALGHEMSACCSLNNKCERIVAVLIRARKECVLYPLWCLVGHLGTEQVCFVPMDVFGLVFGHGSGVFVLKKVVI